MSSQQGPPASYAAGSIARETAGEWANPEWPIFFDENKPLNSTLASSAATCCTHHGIALTLRTTEELLQPCDMFDTGERSITARNRAVLVDWLLDVAQEFALRGDTLFLAVDLLDRHLSCKDESTAWLQLLGSACMWTAAKVEEMYAPSAQDMISLTENIYTAGQLVQMERHLLLALQHSVVRPNTYTFLSTLLHISHAEEIYGSPPHSTPATCPMCYWETCELQATAAAATDETPISPRHRAGTGDAHTGTGATGDTDPAHHRFSSNGSNGSSTSCGTQAMSEPLSCLDLSRDSRQLCSWSTQDSSGSFQGPTAAATRPARCSLPQTKPSILPSGSTSQDGVHVPRWLVHAGANDSTCLRSLSDSIQPTGAKCSNGAGLNRPSCQLPAAEQVTYHFQAEDVGRSKPGAGAGAAGAGAHAGWLRDEDNDGVKCDREAQAHMQLVYLARLVAEACLLDHKLLHFLPSQVSAACLMVARTMLGKAPWSPALAQHAEVDGPHALAACVVAVADAYARARQDTDLSSLQARYGFRRMNVFALEPSAAALELVASCRSVAAMAQPCAASTSITTSRSVTPSIPTPGYTPDAYPDRASPPSAFGSVLAGCSGGMARSPRRSEAMLCKPRGFLQDASGPGTWLDNAMGSPEDSASYLGCDELLGSIGADLFNHTSVLTAQLQGCSLNDDGEVAGLGSKEGVGVDGSIGQVRLDWRTSQPATQPALSDWCASGPATRPATVCQASEATTRPVIAWPINELAMRPAIDWRSGEPAPRPGLQPSRLRAASTDNSKQLARASTGVPPLRSRSTIPVMPLARSNTTGSLQDVREESERGRKVAQGMQKIASQTELLNWPSRASSGFLDSATEPVVHTKRARVGPAAASRPACGFLDGAAGAPFCSGNDFLNGSSPTSALTLGSGSWATNTFTNSSSIDSSSSLLRLASGSLNSQSSSLLQLSMFKGLQVEAYHLGRTSEVPSEPTSKGQPGHPLPFVVDNLE